MSRKVTALALMGFLGLNAGLAVAWSAAAGPAARPVADAEVTNLFGGQTGTPDCWKELAIACDSCDGLDPMCKYTEGSFLYYKENYYEKKQTGYLTCTYKQAGPGEEPYLDCGFVLTAKYCYSYPADGTRP